MPEIAFRLSKRKSSDVSSVGILSSMESDNQPRTKKEESQLLFHIFRSDNNECYPSGIMSPSLGVVRVVRKPLSLLTQLHLS
jgi:hypothetical protein